MRLIVARHGATFLPGTEAVWLGGQADPPLTATGFAQADAVAHLLQAARVRLDAAWSSPLKRARDFAARVTPIFAHTSDALGELDYGLWANRSHAQVRAQGDAQALAAWTTSGIYPPNAGFRPDADAVRAAWTSWLHMLTQQHAGHEDVTVFAVSHHGRLRQLHKMLVPPGDAAPTPSPCLSAGGQMACGHLAVLQTTGASWQVLAWNLSPTHPALLQLLGASDGIC